MDIYRQYIERDFFFFYNIYAYILCICTSQGNTTVTWELHKMAYGYIFSKTGRSEKKVQIVNLRHPIPIPIPSPDFSCILKGPQGSAQYTLHRFWHEPFCQDSPTL